MPSNDRTKVYKATIVLLSQKKPDDVAQWVQNVFQAEGVRVGVDVEELRKP